MTVHSSPFIERFVDSVTTRPLLNDLVRMRAERKFWSFRMRAPDLNLDPVTVWGRDEAA